MCVCVWVMQEMEPGHRRLSHPERLNCTLLFSLVWLAFFIKCDYLSDPCHIQGDTLRSFDILTATQDGHNLQRQSMQGNGEGRGMRGEVGRQDSTILSVC